MPAPVALRPGACERPHHRPTTGAHATGHRTADAVDVSRFESERGAALVTVVVWLPVLMLIPVFVIDVGNWFEHRRHLQLQADASVLAGAAELRFGFGGPCDDAAVESAARLYSGESADGYNQQVGGTSPDDVHFLLNSTTYHEQPDRTDATVVAEPPCDAGMVDVKLTETDLPLFFQVAGLFTDIDYINSHARVALFSQQRRGTSLPVAIPDSNPQSARVTFVDEATGDVLAGAPLKRSGTANGLALWDNAADPLSLTLDREHVGVRIHLGGAASTDCDDPLVECYDADDPEKGIVYLRGYSTAGSGAQPGEPRARSVELVAGTCADAYFVHTGSQCSIGVRAAVDFGPCDELAGVGAELTAEVAKKTYALDLVDCPAGTATATFETTGTPIPVAPDAGPLPVELRWAETKGKIGTDDCKSGEGNKCKGTFGVVQRAFSAVNDRSGPIRRAEISGSGGGGANSLERCSDAQSSCTYQLTVRIGVEQDLQENAQSPDSKPVSLRLFREAENNPSQNQSLDCDPDLDNLRDELAHGCAPEYEQNEGSGCPDQATLWGSPQPWQCVAIQTGGATGQVFPGINERVHGDANPTSCVSPSHWASFPELDPADPRIVPVFLTPFGSFSGSGSTTVPVTGFATFYVTGWASEGKTSQSICPTDDLAASGEIVGHFIKYVQAFNDGSAGPSPCDPADPAPCVAVLTE